MAVAALGRAGQHLPGPIEGLGEVRASRTCGWFLVLALDCKKSSDTEWAASPDEPSRRALPSDRPGQPCIPYRLAEAARPAHAGWWAQGGLCEPGVQALAGVVRAAHGLPEVPPEAGLPPPRGAARPAASTRQGEAGLGLRPRGQSGDCLGRALERRPRPCSAASEGPVFRSRAAGNPRRQGHGPPLVGFLPGRRCPSGLREAATCVFYALRPGLDRAPEVSVCPAPM